jgi:hypothetical protein
MAGKPVFEVPPEPFEGIQLGRIRGKEEQPDIARQTKSLGFGKGPVVKQEEGEAGGVSGGEVREEELKALGIEERQFQKEALARQGVDGPVEGETREAVGCRDERLDPTGGDAAAQDGQQAAAAFVLGPQAPVRIPLLLRGLYLGQDLRGERVVEVRNLCGLFFGWERRGALGLALHW